MVRVAAEVVASGDDNERGPMASAHLSVEVRMTRGLGGDSPANLASFLGGIDYPAGRGRLVEHARQNGAEEKVLDALESLPEREYQNMADVMKGYGATE